MSNHHRSYIIYILYTNYIHMYIPNCYIISKGKTKIKHKKHLKNMSILSYFHYVLIQKYSLLLLIT